MRTESRVIDLNKTEYGTYAAIDTPRVIRNTYQLLALSTGVAGVGAGVSLLAGAPWRALSLRCSGYYLSSIYRSTETRRQPFRPC